MDTAEFIPSDIPSVVHVYTDETRVLVHNPDRNQIAIKDTFEDWEPMLDVAIERGFKLELHHCPTEINLDGTIMQVIHMYDLIPPVVENRNN